MKYAPSYPLFHSHLKAEKKNALNNKEVCINDECIHDEHKNRIIGDQCQSKSKLENNLEKVLFIHVMHTRKRIVLSLD